MMNMIDILKAITEDLEVRGESDASSGSNPGT